MAPRALYPDVAEEQRPSSVRDTSSERRRTAGRVFKSPHVLAKAQFGVLARRFAIGSDLFLVRR